MLCILIFFEISSIPTSMLVIGWGYQPEQLQAGVCMMLYTTSCSLPLLITLVIMGNLLCSFNIMLVGYLNFLWLVYDVLWFLGVLRIFLVKLLMFSVHLWLPKSHVEAPIAGSMILAGVLLKRGGHGVLRWLRVYSLIIYCLIRFLLFYIFEEVLLPLQFVWVKGILIF